MGIYKVCARGDLVVNRMSAYQGALGMALESGLVSPDYLVLRPRARADSRFLHYLLRSAWFVAEMSARLKGIGSIGQSSVRTPRINFEELGDIVLRLPEVDVQRRIADYLDAETARIDALIERRQQQRALLAESINSKIAEIVTGDCGRASPFPWVEKIDSSSKVVPVYGLYDVQLGKMLSEATSSGPRMRPYLRNANVSWGAIGTDDLAFMNFTRDEDRRYQVRSGDLLVCEGGAGVAEAGVWDGSPEPMYFQKSLHRARRRTPVPVSWLMYWLRLIKSVGVLSAQGNLATIPHLTGEQLREMRIVVPEDPGGAVATLDLAATRIRRASGRVSDSIALLAERRQALITAAVTGEFAVPGAT